MASYSRQLLSGSANGRTIPIAATATPGTLLHTALSGTTGFDEVYAWVSNTTGSAIPLTIEWGGNADPGDLIVKQLSIPPNSPPIPILTGQVLQNGLAVRAFAASAGLNVTGYCNRIA